MVLRTPGLGNSTYLLGLGESAVVIDPPRDGWRVAEVAEERGWRITHALETHVHNDYLSGARELRRAHGTTIVAPRDGRLQLQPPGRGEGFELPSGSGAWSPEQRPGTPPSTSAGRLQDGAGESPGLFSGGSLLIGGVGRTDLLGRARTAELTEAQFASMRRLAELPDEVIVYPTHGAGSFCVAGDADGPETGHHRGVAALEPGLRGSRPAAFDRQLAGGSNALSRLLPSHGAAQSARPAAAGRSTGAARR